MAENKKQFEIPLYEKPFLSIEEASVYTGIGRDKLYELTNPEDCPFVLWIGNRRMIKRRVFDEYIEKCYSICREVLVMGNSEIVERFKSRSSEVPLWHRQNISVEEASGYTGLGRDTIYSLTQEDDCDFVLKVGHRTMIKRKKFENYLENLSSI